MKEDETPKPHQDRDATKAEASQKSYSREDLERIRARAKDSGTMVMNMQTRNRVSGRMVTEAEKEMIKRALEAKDTGRFAE